jgi:hypothetical protein
VKKYIAVFIALLIMPFLTACGDAQNSDSVIGRWAIPSDQQKALHEEYGEEFAKISANVYYEFLEDGTVILGGHDGTEEYSQAVGYIVDGDGMYIEGIYSWCVMDGDRLLRDGELAMVRQ